MCGYMTIPAAGSHKPSGHKDLLHIQRYFMEQTPVVFVVFHMFFAKTADDSEQTKKRFCLQIFF